MLTKAKIGDVYSRLTILDVIHDPPQEIKVLCLCSCGKKKVISFKGIRSGMSKSCGCFRKETLHARKEPALKVSLTDTVRYYRNGAAQRQLDFLLTKKEIDNLTLSNCYYCGSSPQENILATKRNGIDRKDSSVGYTTTNCVPCCTFCNYAKNDRPLEVFQAWLTRVKINSRPNMCDMEDYKE
jgi:hypothetical protein